MPNRKMTDDEWDAYVKRQIATEVLDESHFTPEARQIIEAEWARRRGEQ